MIRAYEEIVDFIATGISPAAVASFEASDATKQRVADLIRREKTTIATIPHVKGAIQRLVLGLRS